MKKIKYFTIIVVLLLISQMRMGKHIICAETKNVLSTTIARNDTVSTLKRNALLARQKTLRHELEKEIKILKQMNFNDVAPETAERLAESQDSICLDLKSRLITVQLELKELEKEQLKDCVQAVLNQNKNKANK